MSLSLNVDFYMVLLLTVLTLGVSGDTIYHEKSMETTESKVLFGLAVGVGVLSIFHFVLMNTGILDMINRWIRAFINMLFYIVAVVFFVGFIYFNRDFNELPTDKKVMFVSSIVCCFIIVIYPGYFVSYVKAIRNFK